LKEMSNDLPASREFYNAGLEQSKTVGMIEGVMEARAALRRLERLERGTVAPDSISNVSETSP